MGIDDNEKEDDKDDVRYAFNILPDNMDGRGIVR